MQNYRFEQKNLILARIDGKNGFDSVSNKWIIKILNGLKIFLDIITLLKYHLEMWHINLWLIHEKCMLDTNNLNINNRIF